MARKKTESATRFHITDAPALAPGVCWITKTGKGPFIDTGVDVQFAEKGRIYLSVDALREMAEQAGLFDELQAESDASYDRGYREGVKETIGDDVRSAINNLGDIAGQLTRYLGDDDQEQPAEPAGAGEELPVAALAAAAGGDEVPDGPRQPQFQGTGSRRRRGPTLLPADPGDGGLLRI